MEKKDLPIYDVTVDELDEQTGMLLISFVDKPAMQIAGIALGEQSAPVTLKLDAQDDMTFTSAVIIPGKPIYRNQPTERYIRFQPEDVKKIRDKFFAQSGEIRLSNKNHDAADVVQAHLVESWIIRDPTCDTALSYGFQDLPAGTLMATYKVRDRDFWESEVKTGNVTGFSLEGMFEEVPVSLSEDLLEGMSEAEFAEFITLLGKLLEE